MLFTKEVYSRDHKLYRIGEDFNGLRILSKGEVETRGKITTTITIPRPQPSKSPLPHPKPQGPLGKLYRLLKNADSLAMGGGTVRSPEATYPLCLVQSGQLIGEEMIGGRERREGGYWTDGIVISDHAEFYHLSKSNLSKLKKILLQERVLDRFYSLCEQKREILNNRIDKLSPLPSLPTSPLHIPNYFAKAPLYPVDTTPPPRFVSKDDRMKIVDIVKRAKKYNSNRSVVPLVRWPRGESGGMDCASGSIDVSTDSQHRLPGESIRVLKKRVQDTMKQKISISSNLLSLSNSAVLNTLPLKSAVPMSWEHRKQTYFLPQTTHATHFPPPRLPIIRNNNSHRILNGNLSLRGCLCKPEDQIKGINLSKILK